jgi:hypothetical protein
MTWRFTDLPSFTQLGLGMREIWRSHFKALFDFHSSTSWTQLGIVIDLVPRSNSSSEYWIDRLSRHRDMWAANHLELRRQSSIVQPNSIWSDHSTITRLITWADHSCQSDSFQQIWFAAATWSLLHVLQRLSFQASPITHRQRWRITLMPQIGFWYQNKPSR